MSLMEELVGNILDTGFASIPRASVDRAKWRVIDTLGCLIAGTDAPGCHGTIDLVKRWGGAEEGSILTHGVKVPAHNAALANSVMARSFDFEPVEAEGDGKSSPAHISGTTVPVAVTVGEWQAVSGKDLIAALVVGDDLAARLGSASGFDFSLGWDNTGTINVFGAAAVACKLLKLDGDAVSNALGISLNQVAGSMAGVWDKAMTFKLCMALAARSGIVSAELAGQGFTGVKDPFVGRHGYFSLYCRDYDITKLTKDLGKRFYADCVIKPYSACRATHPAIDSALKVACGNEMRPERVKRIVVNVSPMVLDGFTGQPFVPEAASQIDAAFSVRYTVATALVRKGVKPAYFSDECIRDPMIAALIDRMELVSGIPNAAPTRVEVTMDDGRVLSATTEVARGEVFKTPLSEEEIRAKFRDNAAYSRAVPMQKAERALEMLESLQDVADMREITGLLA